ncbi:MAG TPA: hypothetical protein PK458_00455 [Phycisphaerae bacterium]|nr:hypothetical protein [Phycisphaerae bacterium]
MDNQKRNIIILALCLTALVVVLGYQWRSSSSEPVVPVTRTIRDFIATWQCLSCEHRLEDRAGPLALPEV